MNMQSDKYSYPNSSILKNKLNINDKNKLFEAEKKLTLIRLSELQFTPINGRFDFSHLKAIHKYIFQDIYDWAGETRDVEIGKGNWFCPVANINSYAEEVFKNYFPKCYAAKDDYEKFLVVFAKAYGDLNALHPFREGNGRAQREFARLVCLECGYDFDLSVTTHQEMLSASKASFDIGDFTQFISIFRRAISPLNKVQDISANTIKMKIKK